MQKICKNCKHFCQYYTKNYSHFNKGIYGFCNKRRELLKSADSCESWKDNESQIEAQKRISLMALKTAITSINEIAQILKETGE